GVGGWTFNGGAVVWGEARGRMSVWAAVMVLLSGHAALRSADVTPPPEPPPTAAPVEAVSPRTEVEPPAAAPPLFQRQYPSPTDDLMAPSPLVPPRQAYQRPMPPPGTVPPGALPPNAIPPIIPQNTPLVVPDVSMQNFTFTRRYG